MPDEPPKSVRLRLPGLYSDLKVVCARMLARQPAASLAPTELLHEAFVELAKEQQGRRAADRSELADKPTVDFKGCFAAACRDVLVDHARKRAAHKRGGGRGREDLRDSIAVDGTPDLDVLAVDEALAKLRELDPLMAEIVESRVFADMTVPECAEALGVSPRTIDRKWQFARAWLRERLAAGA
jgi:RNA polymerase sigma factor (TIGR02999 family)